MTKNLAIFFTLSLLVCFAGSLSAQEAFIRKDIRSQGVHFHEPGKIICYSGDFQGHMVVPPDNPEAFYGNANSSNRTKDLEKFEVFWLGSPPDSARNAFETALNIWEGVINTNQVIRVEANWSNTGNPSTLAFAAPTATATFFPNSPKPDIEYPISLAEKFANENFNGTQPDISITFNADRSDWYFSADGDVPSGRLDFITVAAHEMAHGLGFGGGRGYSEDTGEGIIAVNQYHDEMVVQLSRQPVLSFENPSIDMGEVLTGQKGQIVFDSDQVDDAIIYTPSAFVGGSSFAHIDQDTYAGTTNGLMTPQLNPGVAIFSSGLSGLMLQDMGWEATIIDFTPLDDTENFNQDFVFTSNVISDSGFDSASFVLHYTTDLDSLFEGEDITVPMVYTGEGSTFSATIPNPGEPTIFVYYLTLTDSKSRVITNPGRAPDTFVFSLLAIQDTIPPLISHTATNFVLASEESLEISGIIEDIFVGVSSAVVEYSINGAAQTPLTMANDTLDIYSTSIPVAGSLSAGDVIQYRIVATDAAQTPNQSVDPAVDLYTVTVEEPSDPVSQYSNDFNTPTNDFFGNSFEIIQVTGFDDPAIHSLHPYEEAGDGNEINYLYQLQVPIIISDENPIMTFDEVVLIEPGEEGTVFGDEQFWDFAVVEGSKNNGATWQPLADGYDSRDNVFWNLRYQDGLGGDPNNPNISTSVGDKGLFAEREINLTSSPLFSAGDVILIRFRLFSDPFAAGWGWAIDNLEIQTGTVTGIEEVLAENSAISIYPNPSSEGVFRINASLKNPTARGQIQVRNVLGREVMVKDITVGNGILNQLLDLQSQPAGVYLITTVIDGESDTQKVVKSR